MGSIHLLYRNILENSTVTTTNEDTDYPDYRLYDRDVGKLFKGTSTGNHTIKADQGAVTQYEVDTLIIPPGHNLTGGVQLSWEHSYDNTTWIDMVTAWSGAAGQIVKEVSAEQDKRYWRLALTALAAIPEIPEVWMGLKIELADVIAWGYQEGPRGNVEKSESLSGRPYLLELGEERQYRNYTCKIHDSDTRDDLEAFFSHSRGKPFWLKDLDDTWLFMCLVDPNVGPFSRPGYGRWDINLEMIEVLA